MARLEDLDGKKVGIDTVVFVYFLEGHPEMGNCARRLFQKIESGSIDAFASDLVIGELIVKPLQQGKLENATEYKEKLPQFPNLNFCTVTREVIITGAELRAIKKLGFVDSLHLASAVLNGCEVFLTNDYELKHPNVGLKILKFSDFKITQT
jgi:predicted nucleic acid-binding protein